MLTDLKGGRIGILELYLVVSIECMRTFAFGEKN